MIPNDSLGTPKWTTDRPRRQGDFPSLRERVMDAGGMGILEDIADRQRKLSSTSAWAILDKPGRNRTKSYFTARVLSDLGLIEILTNATSATGTNAESYRLTSAGWDLVGGCPLHLVVA